MSEALTADIFLKVGSRKWKVDVTAFRVGPVSSGGSAAAQPSVGVQVDGDDDPDVVVVGQRTVADREAAARSAAVDLDDDDDDDDDDDADQQQLDKANLHSMLMTFRKSETRASSCHPFQVLNNESLAEVINATPHWCTLRYT